MNPTTAGILLHVSLAPLQQEGSGNNPLLGLLLFAGAAILIFVFWQWWQYIEGEASEQDVRQTDAVTVHGHEAETGPAASSARFAARIVPTAETAVARRIP